MAFLNAKAAAPVAKKKASGPVHLIPNYAEVAAISACIKSLEALLELKKGPITDAAQKRLIAQGLAQKSKPDAISLTDRGAGGSCYIRRKDARQPLTQDELDVIGSLIESTQEDGQVVAIAGITEAVAPVLALNPVYAGDEALLAKVDKALVGVKGIPDDLIIQAVAAKTLVAESAFDRLFQEKPEVVEAVFPLLGSTVLKPVFKNLTEAWAIVNPMLKDAPAEPAKKRA
jgi:hypothetical protein